ncbi:MAG: CPBP family intramembrane glutamic endopeptidase [Phototrophicaceae bacterium]
MFKRLARGEPAPPWSYLTALGTIIAMFLSVIIGSTIASVIFDDTAVSLLVGWSIGMALTVVFVMVNRRTPEGFDALRLGRTASRLPLVALLAFGVAVFFDLIGWIITGDQTLASAELIRLSAEETSLIGWVVALLFMGFLQPLGEEIVFRGMAFPAVRSTVGALWGFVVVAGLHAVFHFAAYPPPPDDRAVLFWYGLALPFLDALFLTGVRAHSGSTRAAVVAHAMMGVFVLLKVITFA